MRQGSWCGGSSSKRDDGQLGRYAVREKVPLRAAQEVRPTYCA